MWDSPPPLPRGIIPGGGGMGVKYNPWDIAGRMDRASVIERIGSEEQVEKRVVVMTSQWHPLQFRRLESKRQGKI
jgi:hypothetical protein